MTDVREKAVAIAAQIVSVTDPIRNIRLDEVDIIESALSAARNAALEEAAGVAEELARAHHGHPFINDRFARTQTAEVLADNIRALKDKE